MTCRQLIYVSRPVVEVTDSVLMDILVGSQIKNAGLGISGLLVFHHRRFMQLLEGDPANVQELMDAIRRDSRHTDVSIVLDQESPRRCMPAWAMAFATSKPLDQGIRDQTFCLSPDEAKAICASMTGEVGRLFREFFGV